MRRSSRLGVSRSILRSTTVFLRGRSAGALSVAAWRCPSRMIVGEDRAQNLSVEVALFVLVQPAVTGAISPDRPTHGMALAGHGSLRIAMAIERFNVVTENSKSFAL